MLEIKLPVVDDKANGCSPEDSIVLTADDWMTGVCEPFIKLFLVTSPIRLDMNEVVAWKCFFVYPKFLMTC